MMVSKGKDIDVEEESVGDVRDDEGAIVKVSITMIAFGGALVVALIAAALAEIIHQGSTIGELRSASHSHELEDNMRQAQIQQEVDRRFSDENHMMEDIEKKLDKIGDEERSQSIRLEGLSVKLEELHDRLVKTSEPQTHQFLDSH